MSVMGDWTKTARIQVALSKAGGRPSHKCRDSSSYETHKRQLEVQAYGRDYSTRRQLRTAWVHSQGEPAKGDTTLYRHSPWRASPVVMDIGYRTRMGFDGYRISNENRVR